MIDGDKIAGVTVEARQEGKTIASTKTDGKGDFTLTGLKPGFYRFVFTKEGLSDGVSGETEIKAGTVHTLKNLKMNIDKGTLAVVRGTVFDANGRIVPGAKIEVFRITNDSLKKIGEKYTNNDGEFGISLPPQNARYRFQASIEGAESASKDAEVTAGEVTRIAISLKAKK